MKATHQPPTTGPDTAITPADLLRGAAHYLRRYGHTQGQFFDTAADVDGPFVPACASGAIMTAACGRCLPHGLGSYDETQDSDTAAAMQAMRAFADWLDGGYTSLEYHPVSSIDVIGDWNDEIGRTLDEVVQALTQAADDWDRAHPTGGAR